MRLGDDRIARGNRRGEIATGNRIEGERKIVRPEHQHRLAQRRQVRTQIGRAVDDGLGPAITPHRVCGLTQLPAGARQFVATQAGGRRQRRLGMRQCNQGVGIGIQRVGVAFQKGSDALDRRGHEFRCHCLRRNDGRFHIVRTTDRKMRPDRLAGGGAGCR